MTDLTLPNFEQPSFSATGGLRDENVISLELTGTADLVVREQLDALLEAVQAEARRRAAKEVVVDFRKLEFMNSSCFKSFVTWVSRLRELPPESQYRLRFQSSPEMHWQRRSMQALKCFAVDLVQLD